LRSAEDLYRLQKELAGREARSRIAISVCAGTGCRACGCEPVARQLTQVIEDLDLASRVEVVMTGCHGFCEKGPIIVFRFPADAPIEAADGSAVENLFYPEVKPSRLAELVRRTIIDREIIERWLYRHPESGEPIADEGDIPFYKNQSRLVFELNGRLDPTRIEDYLAEGGYSMLARALLHSRPEEVIEQVKASGLRGRGGGGFPTGRKWATCRRAPGHKKYLICNADEGDPGAFMDRSLLEGNPHQVLEGMIIGSHAIGAHDGFIYVRDEYPLAVRHTVAAIEQARSFGLLGRDILGSGHDFDVRIVRGGGAFVCGESTALMASLEGRMGEPRAKYVHTVEEGLWGQPSNLNNVETWATVPLILRRTAEEFAELGTERSTGTKIFSLVGKVRSTGLVEVAMGTTLREIVEDVGGGVPKGRKLKAVQTGGPSGGCVPESLMDLPVDFDELTEAGSMMGSGGLIVMDERTCMVDVARYFVGFLRNESCGKCVPCRSGLAAMEEILDRICRGEGKPADIDFLSELGDWMTKASLCGLGSSAANPVSSTLRYFPEEYEAHIREQRCPAGVCKELITYSIDADLCTGCGLCIKACPTAAISGAKKEVPALDTSRCTKCGACVGACRFDAIVRA
jgi:NADH-quinone oxidoreductase subunit F